MTAKVAFKLITSVMPVLGDGSKLPGNIENVRELERCRGEEWRTQPGEAGCYLVEPGEQLTLSPVENPGWAFYRYSKCPGLIQGRQCWIRMPAQETKVTAEFERAHALEVTLNNSEFGVVRTPPDDVINCGDDCVANFFVGSKVSLKAEPKPNNQFVGWSEDCTGTNTTCALTMDGSKKVMANFKQCTCSGRQCGDNGCGRSCGRCSPGQNCQDGKCVRVRRPWRR